MKNHIGRAVALGIVAGALSPAWAADVGMPVYSQDLGKGANLEIYCERYKRDIERDYAGWTSTERQEENRLMARVVFPAGPRASLHVEVGAVDSKQADGTAPLLGAGLKAQIYESENLTLGAFASAAYVHEIQYTEEPIYALRVDGTEPSQDALVAPTADLIMPMPAHEQKASYFEINGGLVLSHAIPLDPRTTFTPYGGFMISKLDGDMDLEWTDYEGTRIRESSDWKEDGLLAFFAGCGVTMDKTFGIRLEGRFVNQTSFSAGLLYFF